MNIKRIILCVGLIAVAVILLFILKKEEINLFGIGDGTACTEEAKICPDGSAVARTGPNCEFAECPSFSGSSFITIKGNDDIISLETPKVGDKIKSPLTVSGKARGNWFFEASFPLILTDWDGKIIAEGFAMAQGEWMTTDFVPFVGELKFISPEKIEGVVNRGSLILKKDNPSGLPEHDDALEIEIFY